MVFLIGHAVRVGGVFKCHKSKWYCNIKKWNKKIGKIQFRDPKKPRKHMMATKTDLKEMRLQLCHLSDDKIAQHTKPKSLKKVPEKNDTL